MIKKPHRGINKFIIDKTLIDLYEDYKSEVPEDEQVTKEIFFKVPKLYGEKFMEKVLMESEEVKFPCGLGSSRIRKSKLFLAWNKLKIDWQLSKKYRKAIYHLNEHRDGCKYRFLWNKGKIKNIFAYKFIPTRFYKRELARILKTKEEIDYFY